jgi:pimeloyl-ACP methyl ester carboxylesterase
MKTTSANQLPDIKEEIVENLPVQYYECGSGTPLILLHGWPQTSYIWRKVLPELQKRYHVFAVELPGMGNTNASPAADTKSVARLIKAFCDQLDLGRVHLMAHDIGAWVAVSFALGYETSLRSLTVLDAGIPGLIPDEIFSPINAKKIWQFYFHAIEEIPEILLAGKEAAYLNWYFTNKTIIKEAISREDITVYVQAYTGPERLKNGFDYYRAFPESARQNKACQNKLQIPILAIGAEYGQGLNMGIAMQKVALTNVQSVSIVGCGHYIAEEQPEELLRVIVPFLEGIND